MAPGEKDKEEFVEDIAIGDIKVVFEIGDVDPSIEVLLHVLLASVQSRLAHLEAHLGGRVCHKVVEGGVGVLLVLGRLAIVVRRGGCRRWRWRRA